MDRNAGLYIVPRCLVLADLSGDGDHRLVLTDIKLENGEKSRLKVYKGTVLVADQTLPDIPSSVISFYSDNSDFKVPGEKSSTSYAKPHSPHNPVSS